MSILKIKNADGVFEDVIALRGVGVKSIVQEGDYFLFTMTDGSVQTVLSADCAEIVRSAASASDSAADASASEENAAASKEAAAASAENAKKSEDEAKAAAENAAKSVLEKLNYNDETGTVELKDYAKKGYVDKGDTTLRQDYDEPKEVNVGIEDREKYFTVNDDQWENYGDPSYFAYSDLTPGDRFISVTAKADLSLTGNVQVWDGGDAMVFSVTVNGETVTSEPAAANGTLSFELTVKAGDTIIFTITNSGSAYSTMIGLKVSVVEEFKLYTAQDIKEEGICNKVFTLQKGSALAELVPPSGYEDFFERREIYPGLTLFVQIPEAITVDGRFLTSGNITNILNNFQKVEISAPSIWMLTCKVADIHMGEVYWTFTELYPNILNGASEAIEAIVAEKLKNQPACIAYKKISSYDVNGWDMFELWGGEKDAWILEEGASFIFIPTNAAGVAKPASISVDGGFGSLRVKEYDSSGNLTDPTLFSGKPVLLYNNGTNFIVVK